MQADLHASFAQVQLVIAGYGLAYAVCLITGGRLGDIFGRKRVFLIGVAGFTLASVLCGLAPSPELLIAARIFQGLSGSLMFPQVLSIIQITFPPHERSPRLRRLRRRLRRRLLLRHRPRRIAGPGQRLRPRLAAHLPRQPAHRPADPAGRLAVRSRSRIAQGPPARPRRRRHRLRRPDAARLSPRRRAGRRLAVVDLRLPRGRPAGPGRLRPIRAAQSWRGAARPWSSWGCSATAPSPSASSPASPFAAACPRSS